MDIITVARGMKKANIVLKNCKMVNVLTKEIEETNIAIHDKKIVGIGDYSGNIEINMSGAFVSPGFIDAHVHIESSMLTPVEFSKLIIPKGTTTVVSDPHEIANVVGIKGIKYMISSANRTPLNTYFMVPSCVPATSFETNGAVIDKEDILSLLKNDSVHGLGEVMDYNGVLISDPKMIDKLLVTKGLNIDGHSPSLSGKNLNAYITSGVMTDHECTNIDEMNEKLRRGMYIHLREGSATRNVKTLIKGVNSKNINRVLFCTDDKHPYDIEKEGHINYNVNLAIEHGVDPIDAIQIATINAADCYRLYKKGAIAPGYDADLIAFDDIHHIKPTFVMINGEIVYQKNELKFEAIDQPSEDVLNTVNVSKSNLDFNLYLEGNKANVIGLIDDNVTTNHLIEQVTVKNGVYINNPNDDILKIAVIERHTRSNHIELGLIKGYGLKNGAVGMTIAHDSHNIIIVGDNDQSMKMVLDDLIKMNGGITIVKNGEMKSHLRLEIGGLMTNKSHQCVSKRLLAMEEDARKMGVHKTISDPFLSLAFMSLSVIPKLKLTDKGLFDVVNMKHIKVGVTST